MDIFVHGKLCCVYFPVKSSINQETYCGYLVQECNQFPVYVLYMAVLLFVLLVHHVLGRGSGMLKMVVLMQTLKLSKQMNVLKEKLRVITI